MSSLIFPQLDASFPQVTLSPLEASLHSFGNTALTIITGASLITAVVGSLGLFGSLVVVSTAIPLAIKVSCIFLGIGTAIFALHLKNEFYPQPAEPEEDGSFSINQGLAALTSEVHAALAELRAHRADRAEQTG